MRKRRVYPTTSLRVCGAAQAERLVSRLEEVGGVLGDLGLALIKVAKFEDEEGARSGAYTLSASASKAIAAEAKRVGTVRGVCHEGVWFGTDRAMRTHGRFSTKL